MTKQTKNKTQPTKASVKNFLAAIKSPQLRKDAQEVSRLMHKISGKPPVMWGPSIVGFGLCHYKYASGSEGDMGAIDFAPRKPNLNIYLVDGTRKYEKLLQKLGPHSTGKVCLYIRRLSEINLTILEEIIKKSYRYAMSHKNDMHRLE